MSEKSEYVKGMAGLGWVGLGWRRCRDAGVARDDGSQVHSATPCTVL